MTTLAGRAPNREPLVAADTVGPDVALLWAHSGPLNPPCRDTGRVSLLLRAMRD